MVEPKAPLQEITHKFLGGSVKLKPSTTFMGKTGMVALPDRITLKVEGASMNMTIEALDALVEVAAMPRAQPFLEALRNAASEQDQ